MDLREKITEFGDIFMVPTWVERIGNEKTHGWQLRFGEWAYFADGASDGSGSAASLKRAVAELKTRIKTSAVPNKLKQNSRNGKLNDLPVGISGPISSKISGSELLQYSLQVTFPRFGKVPANKKIYIGTENTYTDERFDRALIKAQKMRDAAVKLYTIEHAASVRKEVAAL